MAPWMRSSHMNQNRCWPGVPNRYRIRPASRVTRPKSIATVVVVLSGVCVRSSTISLAEVMTASVVSGVISDTEPTKVVLPTPKPPATTIFTDVIAASVVSPAAALELAKSTEHPFEQVEVRTSMLMVGLVDPDQALHRHVRDQDPGDTERHPEHRRYLRDRPPVPAESQDGLALRAQRGEVPCLIVRGRDHGLDLQLVPGLRPAAGDRVRADQGTLLSIRCAIARSAEGSTVSWYRDALRPVAVVPGNPVRGSLAIHPGYWPPVISARADTGISRHSRPSSRQPDGMALRTSGVSALPTRSTSSAISYATRPMSQSAAASAARLEPSLIAITISSPRCISTTV